MEELANPAPAFTVTNASSWLNQGLNTLTLDLAVVDNFFEGVRMEATLTGTSVPEPTAVFALLTLGSFGLLRRSPSQN